MRNLERIKKEINGHKALLKERFKVKSISLFGSYLRDEQTKGSDIDLLIEFSGPIDLFEFIKLEDFLSEMVGHKVDLVMKEALKPRLKDRILKEAVSI